MWTNQHCQNKFSKANSFKSIQGCKINLIHSRSTNKVCQTNFGNIFNTRHTWLDQADQIELLRLSWSNQLEQISGSNNDEQIKLVKLGW